MALSKNATQHNRSFAVMLSVIKLNVKLVHCYAGCHYAKCHYAECHYAKCRYAECHYTKCRYAGCRGAMQ
jgi:hypothetical protein